MRHNFHPLLSIHFGRQRVSKRVIAGKGGLTRCDLFDLLFHWIVLIFRGNRLLFMACSDATRVEAPEHQGEHVVGLPPGPSVPQSSQRAAELLDLLFSIENLRHDAELLARMNGRMMISLNHLVTHSKVKRIGLSEEDLLSAAKATRRIFVDEVFDDVAYVGPLAQSGPKSRCTILIQSTSSSPVSECINSRASAQEIVGASPILHSFVDEGSNTMHLTFEDDSHAKTALFEATRNKTARGLDIQCRLRIDNSTQTSAPRRVVAPAPSLAAAPPVTSAPPLPGVAPFFPLTPWGFGALPLMGALPLAPWAMALQNPADPRIRQPAVMPARVEVPQPPRAAAPRTQPAPVVAPSTPPGPATVTVGGVPTTATVPVLMEAPPTVGSPKSISTRAPLRISTQPVPVVVGGPATSKRVGKAPAAGLCPVDANVKQRPSLTSPMSTTSATVSETEKIPAPALVEINSSIEATPAVLVAPVQEAITVKAPPEMVQDHAAVSGPASTQFATDSQRHLSVDPRLSKWINAPEWNPSRIQRTVDVPLQRLDSGVAGPTPSQSSPASPVAATAAAQSQCLKYRLDPYSCCGYVPVFTSPSPIVPLVSSQTLSSLVSSSEICGCGCGCPVIYCKCCHDPDAACNRTEPSATTKELTSESAVPHPTAISIPRPPQSIATKLSYASVLKQSGTQ